MELLFEKEGEIGGKEFKTLLGFADADIKFSSIKADIITATNEMIRFTGQEAYDAVLEAYKAADQNPAQQMLVHMYRYPIAVRAYAMFAPNNDVAHTNNGRRMRMGDNEKQAFEWLLDRDNEATEKRFYRAMDDLVQYMDKNLEEWKASGAFKRSHSLFLRTTYEFDEYLPLESRYVLLKLEPGIRQCEQNEILPRLGRVKFEALKQALKSNTDITDEKDTELLALIKEASCYYAIAWGITRLSVNIFPEGVLQSYTSDRETTKIKRPAQKLEAEAARMAYAGDAERVLLKIEKLVAPAVQPTACTEGDIINIISGDNFLSI
jgi:hypothetical protein